MEGLAEAIPSPAPSDVGPVHLEMDRQMSWALPELPRNTSSLYAWGRSDLGQTGTGGDENVPTPQQVTALGAKDVVHVAGSAYNSAFVTRESFCIFSPCSHRPSALSAARGNFGGCC